MHLYPADLSGMGLLDLWVGMRTGMMLFGDTAVEQLCPTSFCEEELRLGSTLTPSKWHPGTVSNAPPPPFCEFWQSINCAAEEQCQGNKAISATICCEQVGHVEGNACYAPFCCWPPRSHLHPHVPEITVIRVLDWWKKGRFILRWKSSRVAVWNSSE